MSTSGSNASRCHWCTAPIKWVRTERGKAMPLDPDPVIDGNVELVNGIAVVHAGLILLEKQITNTVLHKAHFATCKSPFNPANQKKGTR